MSRPMTEVAVAFVKTERRSWTTTQMDRNGNEITENMHIDVNREGS